VGNSFKKLSGGERLKAQYSAAAVVHDAVVRVRYAETDQMGVVYHSNFFIWFEIGRVELLRKLGFSYRQMESDGYHLPVVEVRCRYKAPALYDDTLAIRTRMVNLRPSLIAFGYEAIRQSDEALLAEGESTHIVVGAGKKKIQLPEKYLAVFRSAIGGEARATL
jgi:acyl-CoA thioester hydrolase